MLSQPLVVVCRVGTKAKPTSEVKRCHPESEIPSKLSLYGAVPAEGGEAPEGGPGQPGHLGDVQVLQRGAGGGEGKEAGLTNVVAASDRELAKTKKGPTKGGQACVCD